MCASRASASTSSGCAYSRSIRSRTRRSSARSRRCCAVAGPPVTATSCHVAPESPPSGPSIGAGGFEPPTSCSQSRRATRLRHAPCRERYGVGAPGSTQRRAPVGSIAAMADVQPLRALHYDPATVGSLQAVVAPPYDVIDPDQRAALAKRSPYNVVRIDLPEADGRSDAYAHAAELLERWQADGAVVRDEEPAIWAIVQDYVAPDGSPRTRRGLFARVRVEEYGAGRIRPHERTHAGPREDRLRLTRATRANLSPIFALYDDPQGAAWSAVESHTHGVPWGDVTDEDGTEHRLWRVPEEDAAAAVRDALRDTELLIADGHHRYETARVYAEELGGEGGH